jgi:protein TonB
MNQIMTPPHDFPATWPMTSISAGAANDEAPIFAGRDLSTTPTSKLRRSVSIAVAVAIQAAFVAGIVSAMGVKLPRRIEPLMVVNIESQPVIEKEIPPPPPHLEQPKVAITLPVMPDVIVDVPTPKTPPATAITAAPPNTPPVQAAPTGEKYETVMLRYINSHLRYPPIARARHHQGVVYVRFMIDRKGNVLSAAIERSSRFPALDEEGLALLRRAQPLPPPPASIAGDQVQLVVPINFVLH